ncbi:MAG: dTDP-4-dehydrorhamnose reductase [Anaerolineales bacterium]
MTDSILLLGKDGQVGHELARLLPNLTKTQALGRRDLDLAQLSQISQIVRQIRPAVIINAAAYTHVDGAESERDLAYAVNADAPRVLAQEAEALGALLIHFSTDYVFDGTKRTPYVESDTPNPINWYGQTKLEGEIAIRACQVEHWIIRTSWVYSTWRDCFVTKVLRWAREQPSLTIVRDQWGSPTWSRTLAEQTVEALKVWQNQNPGRAEGLSGTYHLAAVGAPSRYEWAKAILQLDPHKEEQIATEVNPATQDAFPSPARRPTFTALSSHRFESAFRATLPAWEVALSAAMGSSRGDMVAGKLPPLL